MSKTIEVNSEEPQDVGSTIVHSWHGVCRVVACEKKGDGYVLKVEPTPGSTFDLLGR